MLVLKFLLPVRTIEVPPVLAAGSVRPAVVDYDLLPDGRVVVQPGQEAGGVPVLLGALGAVRPHQVRLIGVDKLVKLWLGFVPREEAGGAVLSLSKTEL